jgi:hypothetical protein
MNLSSERDGARTRNHRIDSQANLPAEELEIKGITSETCP